MIVPKFNRGYKEIKEIQKDFVNNSIDLTKDYFQKDYFEVPIENIVPFHIYLADFPSNEQGEKEKTEAFIESCNILREHYIKYLDREVLLDGDFWYSFILCHFRKEILSWYPQVKNSLSKFRNVLLKRFDWENYIYKMILAVQYIERNVQDHRKKEHYYRLIANNLDLYNYIIKYEVFRTDRFLINILDIIEEYDLSNLLKRKIKGREDLGDDERYGRRVIYEFNKGYPVLLSPMMEKKELEGYFFEYLSYYYEGLEVKRNESTL